MALSERPHPLPPEEQIARWLHEGATLKELARKIRTPALKDEIAKRLAQQAKEATAPKPVTTIAVTGG
jgi:hypothetical protein